MKNETIYIGTSGWSYKHWAGLFYPAGLKASAQLAFYAARYRVSEINNSFYRLPKPDVVEKWVSEVPKGFLFCPKMNRYLSHMKKLRDPQEPLTRFFGVFDPFQDHLGPILVQLPANVHFHFDVVEPFYNLLSSVYAQYTFAMEVRHESWFSEQSLDLMRQHRVTLVLAQSGIYPYHEVLTAKDIYVRLHGPSGLYSSSYSKDEIAEFARKFIAWNRQGHRVWAFFNNDVNGYAIQNADALQKCVDELS